MTAAYLRPEVQDAVGRIDLTAMQREQVGAGDVDAGLARDGDTEAGLGDELPITVAEEPGRITERVDWTAESGLEGELRTGDLLPCRVILEGNKARVSNRMRLEAECPRAIELDDVIPREQWRLAAVPGERGRAVDGASRDEDGGSKLMLFEYR